MNTEGNKFGGLKNEGDENSEINYLNDDCLIKIFEYLSVHEKLKMESVCKNWNRVVKLSWGHLNFIDLGLLVPYKGYEDLDKYFQTKNTNYLIMVLKRCGSYLKILKVCTLSLQRKVLVPQLLNVIPKYCHNIYELHVTDLGSKKDIDIENLIFKNPNLKSIHFMNLKIKDEYFCNLNPNKIKEINFYDNVFDSNVKLYDFLTGLKNLNSFNVTDKFDRINKMIQALMVSECQRITEFMIQVYGLSQINDLTSLLTKQKEIRKLELYNVFVDQNFIAKLPTECIEELVLVWNFIWSNITPQVTVLDLALFLSKAKKLRKLKLHNLLISYRVDANATNLEEIDLQYNKEQTAINQMNISLFLSQQKKIRKLRLHNVLINDVLKSQEDDVLEELILTFSKVQTEEKILNIATFLNRKIKLRRLSLISVLINEDLLQSFPTGCLEELALDLEEIELCDNKLNFLKRLKNLQVFKVYIDLLSDQFLEALTKFINVNIKDIEIYYIHYTNSVNKILDFNRLQDLESFKLLDSEFPDDEEKHADNKSYCLNNILKNLSQCKNLKYLEIETCKFSTLGLNSISCLPNLLTLNVSFSYNLSEVYTDKEFLDFIEKSISLKKLIIRKPESLSLNFIRKASEIKVKRGDKSILTIIFFPYANHTCIYPKVDIPLINFIYNH